MILPSPKVHGVEVGTLIRMDDDATEGRRLLHKVVHPPSVAARVARFGLDLGIGMMEGWLAWAYREGKQG